MASVAIESPITLVLFDMDDVLCDYDRPARIAHLAAMAGCAPEHVDAAIFASGHEALGDSGALDSAAYLAGFGERLGYDLSLEEWVTARRAGTACRPAMLDLVRRLTVRAAVLTNNSRLVTDHIDRIAPELPALFPGRLFASAGLGAAKPDAACFDRCLDALGATPAETLFIDDLAENVDGARRAGLRAHRFTSVAGLTAALDAHDLLAVP